jgi:hypothetical protein
MSEIWLHTNRRVIVFALIWPAAGLALGLLLATALASMPWIRWLGVGLAAVSAWFAILFVWQLRQPRIARRGDELLFYLRTGAPLRVPLAVVEGFLLGQGPSYLRADKPAASQVATVVVRLADRATDFAHRDVKPALGSWCNHYVTIRGTWCEPLSVALVTRLNTRLADAHTALQPERTRP